MPNTLTSPEINIYAKLLIVEFTKNGFQATVSTDAYPVDPNLFQWLCNTI